MPNRLAEEKSPYLLQHANNPVDWYPWGDEAFEKAKREDKPVFLSIGYSTCHWCHVMERESFENDAVAQVLNEHFVSIKVDREERPDVDRIYMLFVQASTGSGGWPMSVFLTPDRKPFYGGTYFPPDNRYGRPGFRSILRSLADAWRGDRARVESSGTQVLAQLHEYAAQNAGQPGDCGREVHDSTYNYFRRSFDRRLGGFGGAPKFPRPSVLTFLLRYYAAEQEPEALEMVLLTLREMAKGGMNDQLGGGFHRYSVDENWFVPHFEKMLYDQAQLAISYLEAYQITRDEQYARIARDIFTYVLRDLSHPDGAFYSAEDADSVIDPADPHEKGEGAFYIWAQSEILDVLGLEKGQDFCRRFGAKPHGNVDHDPQGEFTGKNILFRAEPRRDDSDVEAFEKLLAVRNRRVRPHLDDKVLTAWNGLMISAFAKGSQILGDESYAAAARRALDFLRLELYPNGKLLRRYRDGEAAVDAYLDDYAFLILGLLDMYETTFERRHLDWAMELAIAAVERFEDRENGGFFSTPEGQADLVMRLKDDYDGAEPSGNSAMTMALLRIARMTGTSDSQAAAERALRAFAGRLRAAGPGLPLMLAAHSFAIAKPMEIVLAGPSSPEMLAAIRSRFLPDAVVVRAEHLPEDRPALDGRPTAYVCENFACRLPATDIESLVASLS